MKLVKDRIDELETELSQYISPAYSDYPLAQKFHVRKAIVDWVKRNFEVYGQSYRMSNELLIHSDHEKYKEHAKKRIATDMALAIFEKCGVSREERKDLPTHFYKAEYSPGYEEITVEMLVMLREPKND